MAERTNPESGAGSAEAEAAPAPSSGGIKAFIPLICTLLLMPALAWGMTQYLLIPRIKKELGLTSSSSAEPAEHAEGEKESGEKGGEKGEKGGGEKGGGEKGGAKQTVTMTKLLVNVAGTMGSRYLLASVTLAGSSAEFKTRVEKKEAQLRDTACSILATKTISDLEKPGARNTLRSELVTAFNNILGGGAVQEMYITEFAIQ